MRPPLGTEIITKKNRILRTDLDCSGVKLDVIHLRKPLNPSLTISQSSGIAREIRTQLPCKAVQDFKAGIVDFASFVYPMPMGFTTNATLYSIEYQLSIRAVLSGAKDLVSTQPIHVCSWGSDTCLQIMKGIEKASRSTKRRESYPQDSSARNNGGKRILVE